MSEVQQARRVDAELREREEQYRSIFEAVTDGLVISNMDGYVVEVNPAFCRMSGYTRDELIGMHGADLTHPDSLYTVEQSLATVRDGRTLHFEGLGLRKDGSVCPAEVHVGTFSYKGQLHMLAVARDITERVQARELLEQRVEERTRELMTLLEVSRNVSSTLELGPLLSTIVEQLKTVVDYTSASITALMDNQFLVLHRVGPGSSEHVMTQHVELEPGNLIWETVAHGDPVIIPDVTEDTALSRAFWELNRPLMQEPRPYIRSWMALPMVLKGRPQGIVALSHSQPGYYTPQHAALSLAFAQQAAVSIENARFYEQAQELAALEERSRLARELHDSVTQALYGIGLAAETTRLLLDKDPARARQSNDTVQSLARAGMAEMRALLFELRPESLELEGLVAALQKQAAALEARHEIPVETVLGEEPSAAPAVKEALYRIAQEALHNAIKHARSTRLEIRLACTGGEVVLEVQDDGSGFDPHGAFPGHLGLRSMQERVTKLGGRLEIESSPGKGTCVQARIPSTSRS